MFPDRNNCYGHFLVAPTLIVDALEGLGEVALGVSGYDGSQRVTFRAACLELDSDPLEGHQHSLNGVADLDAGGLALLERVSARLLERGIVHRFEIYDRGDREIAYFHFGCPRVERANLLAISVAARCVTGPRREANEDRVHVIDLDRARVYRPPIRSSRLVGAAFVLGAYDGCGGGKDVTPGDLAMQEIETWMRTAPDRNRPDAMAAHLREGVVRANRAFFERARLSAGMGATAVVAALYTDSLAGPSLAVAHVGDCRAYLFRDARLTALTRDHTLGEELRELRARHARDAAAVPVEKRRLLEAEESFAFNNIITRALGSTDTVDVDVTRIDLRPGDRLILCSDGLSGLVADTRLVTILEQYTDADDACDALVWAAETAGGDDNISVIAVTYYET